MARRLSANSGIKNGHRSGRNRASPLSRLPPRMSYIRVADRDDRARLARRYGGRDECTPSNWPGSVDLSWNFTLEARKDESVHGASTEVSFHVVRIVPPAPQCELVAGVVARLRCRHATAGRQAHCVLRLCRYAQGYAQKRRRRTNRQHCRHHDLPHVRPPRVSCAQSSLRYRIAVCAPVVTMVFRMTQRILWRSIAILKDDRSQDRLARWTVRQEAKRSANSPRMAALSSATDASISWREHNGRQDGKGIGDDRKECRRQAGRCKGGQAAQDGGEVAVPQRHKAGPPRRR